MTNDQSQAQPVFSLKRKGRRIPDRVGYWSLVIGHWTLVNGEFAG